jgi:hypothetical protein
MIVSTGLTSTWRGPVYVNLNIRGYSLTYYCNPKRLRD